MECKSLHCTQGTLCQGKQNLDKNKENNGQMVLNEHKRQLITEIDILLIKI